MIRALLALLAVLLLVAPTAHAGQGYGVEVLRTTPERLTVTPGEVVTHMFRVTAQAGGPTDWLEVIELPPGWRALPEASVLALTPGAPHLRVLAVHVPPGAPAGGVAIRYGVVDPADPARRDVREVRLDIARVERISVRLVDAPPFVLAGEAAELTVEVANDGNTPATVRLEADPEAGLGTAPSPRTLELGARARTQVVLKIGTRADEPRPTTRVVRVRASSGEITAEEAVLLEVTPRPGAGRDLWRRFPLVLTTTGTWGTGARAGGQLELKGAGALDAGGQWTGDLLVRGPDAHETGPFGRRDELRASVTGPWVAATLGDVVYSLSPLTSPYRYGRGGGALLTPGALRLGGFLVEDRFAENGPLEVGATFGANLGARGHLALHHLRRLRTDEAAIWSLGGEVQPLDGLTVQAEGALDTETPGTPAWALRLAADGAFANGVAFSVREVVAQPGYGGYERDIHRTSGSVVVPAGRQVRLQAAWQRLERNLDRDRSRGAAPVEQRGEVGATWDPASPWGLSTAVLGATRRELLGALHWREAALRSQLAYGGRHLSATLQALIGAHQDVAEGEVSDAEQVAATLVANPHRRVGLRAWGSWSSDGDPVGSLFHADTSVGGGVSWQPLDSLRVEAEGRHVFGPGTPHDHLDARLHWRHATGAAVTARWNTRWSAGTPSHAGLVEVSVPVGVPIGRSGTAGGIEGRIFDVDAPGHPGLAGVVVRVGAWRAVTDADGRFHVGPLPAGLHLVEVDRATLGLDRVAVADLPARVEVPAGGLATLELGTQEGARLTGVLRTLQRPVASGGIHGTAEDAPARLAGVPVVLRSGDARHVRATDGEGRFSVDGLRPGTWEVTVEPSLLPAHHRLEPLAVELSPGDVEDAEVVAAPVQRAVRMVAPAPVEVALRDTAPPPPPRAARPPRPARPATPPAPPVVAWQAARVEAEADVAPTGDFLGGQLAVVVRDGDGVEACRASAAWVDDGGDLPLDPCPSCAWSAHTDVMDVQVAGPSCHDLGPAALEIATGAWGWAPAVQVDGRTLHDVLLRHAGDGWRVIATGVDPTHPTLTLDVPLP